MSDEQRQWLRDCERGGRRVRGRAEGKTNQQNGRGGIKTRSAKEEVRRGRREVLAA